jgi:hypothetical protein
MSVVQTMRLVVNRRALVRACARAAEHGVARGGLYDVRGSALVIWPEPRGARPLKRRGEPIGMISWEWSVPAEPFATVTRVEAAEGHSPDEMLAHLHRLLNPTRAVGPGDGYLA